jgi:hypothetical protein
MARLHYGPTLCLELDPRTTRQITETIGAHATRGGWITFTDRATKEWSILITPGIPVWLEPDSETPKPPDGATGSS